jgi:hypothetical protein
VLAISVPRGLSEVEDASSYLDHCIGPTWEAPGHIPAQGSSPDLSQLRLRPQASTEVYRVTMFKSQLLYQLSYAGAPVIVFAESSSGCRLGHGRPPALLSKLLSNPEKLLSNLRVSRGATCWSFRAPLRRQVLFQRSRVSRLHQSVAQGPSELRSNVPPCLTTPRLSLARR